MVTGTGAVTARSLAASGLAMIVCYRLEGNNSTGGGGGAKRIDDMGDGRKWMEIFKVASYIAV